MKKLLLLLFAVIFTGGLSACETAAILMMNASPVTSLHVEGEKLYVMDLLNSKTFDQMKNVVEKNPQVDTLIFTAMPGSIDDETTFAMGRWLRKQKLNTHLTAKSAIASGAVDLFLSGVERTMEEGAQLGVHSWSDGSKEAADYPRNSQEHDLNKSYIVDMGVPADFYWFTIYEAPADKISWMTEADITKYNIITQPIQKVNTSKKIPFDGFGKLRMEILE